MLIHNSFYHFSIVYLFLMPVQINFICSDNVHILFMYRASIALNHCILFEDGIASHLKMDKNYMF